MVQLAVRQLFRDPRRRVAVSLTAVWLISAWHFGGDEFLWWPALCATAAVATEVLWHYVVRRRFVLNPSAAVSGLLIGLLIYPTSPWYFAVAIPAFAIVLKLLLCPGRRPLFNPAALALVVASVTLNAPTSWWGVAWSPWLGVGLALSVLDVLKSLKLWPVTLSFLVGYTVYLSLFSSLGDVWPLVVDGTVLAFAFIMLPEPRSGPQGWPWFWQVGFAVLVLGGIALFGLFPTLPFDLLLAALLLAALLFSVRRLAAVWRSAQTVARSPNPLLLLNYYPPQASSLGSRYR